MNRPTWPNKTTQLILMVLTGLAILAIGSLLLTYFNRQPPDAQVQISSGKAELSHANGQKQTLTAPASVALQLGDTLQTDGQASIKLPATDILMQSKSTVTFDQYRWEGDVVAGQLTVKEGQLRILSVPSADKAGVNYRMVTPFGTIAWAAKSIPVEWSVVLMPFSAQLGVIAGQVQVTRQNEGLTIAGGQGILLDKTTSMPRPAPWSIVRVAIYRPDGTWLTNLPASMTRKNEAPVWLDITRRNILPPDTYTLSVDGLITPLNIEAIQLKPDISMTLPLTLAEVDFGLIQNELPIRYDGQLILTGQQEERRTLNSPLLISPGAVTFSVAKDDNPKAVQQISLNTLPGQRLSQDLDASLFGSAHVSVDFQLPKDTTLTPIQVLIFKPDDELTPIASFSSKDESPLLLQGNYVVRVETRVAIRFEITVKDSQPVKLNVPMGFLAVRYVDDQDRLLGYTRTIINEQILPLADIAPADITSDDLAMLRRDYSRYLIVLSNATPLLVPAGKYTIMINDRPNAIQNGVIVNSQQTTEITLKRVAQATQ